MKQTSVAVLLAVSAVAGCASKSENVVATYVSPSTYSSYNCKQIIAERNMVVNKVNELSGVQDKKGDK